MSTIDQARTRAAAVLLGYQHKAPGADVAGRALLGADLADSLTYLLAVLDATALVVRGSQLETLRQALTDAIAYRDPSGTCPDCDLHPAGLCEDHAQDLDKTDAYLALAAELGIEVER